MNWIQSGKSKEYKSHIHPSGWNEGLYNASGIETAKMIQKYIKPESVVLEYGVGNGRLLRHLKNCKKMGVDIVPEFVDECVKLGYDAKLIKDFNFNSDIDLIYCITVFIHLNKIDGYVALKKIYDGLKVGGFALVQIPIYDVAREPTNWIDVGVWDEKLFRETVKDLGFEIVQLHKSPGAFSYNNIGINHDKCHLLKKI